MSALNNNQYVAFLSALVIAVVAGFLLLLTGIWYLLTLGGFVAALIVRKRTLTLFISTFISGILVSLIYVIMLPIPATDAVVDEVATIAGISALILWTLLFLVSALLASAGALIGSAIAPMLEK